MKRILTSILVVTMMMQLFVITGCKQAEVQIDASDILDSLLNQVSYSGELAEVGENAALHFPDLPEGTEIQLYTVGGYSADEVALFILPEASDMAAAVESVKQHIEERHSQFLNYAPEEAQKIENAVLCQSGKYLFLCITDDMEHVNQVLADAKLKAMQM